MKALDYPSGIKELIAQLKRMPGVGPKSAERIALWMVQAKNARPEHIAQSILDATQRITLCGECGFFVDNKVCEICSNPNRNHGVLCVVEQPTDIIPLERTGVFQGHYHTLGGRLSPLDHVGPEDLRLSSLLRRIREGEVKEVILALGGDVEGEATAHYLLEILRDFPVTVTRIAQGLPAGGGLESADELTLRYALTGRTKMPVSEG